MWKVVFVFFLFIGCEEEESDEYCTVDYGYPVLELSIDYGCGTDAELIQYAVDILNDWTNKHVCQDLVRLTGDLVDIDHSDRAVPDHTVICYYSRPDWFDNVENQKLLGLAGYNTKVRLFFWREMIERFRLSVILHELGHYIGIGIHSKHPGVMTKNIDPLRTSFTKNDTYQLCSVYECEN